LAPFSNWLANPGALRAFAERITGIDRRRPLPVFQRETLQRWFRRRRHRRRRQTSRGRVVFLADSFTSYTEPWIGKAAIELLEVAGWEVELAGHVCCGRALISKGLLKEARVRHAALIARLGPAAREGVPIVGCEPSCVFTLTDELPALSRSDTGAAAIARQARLVDALLAEAIADGTLPLPDSAPVPLRILFHGHCHQKAAGATAGSIALLKQLPGTQVDVLDAGCCGMAGSFGFEREHYELSMEIGGLRLFPAVQQVPDALVAASGVSCRQQIAQGTGRQAVHPVVLLHQVVTGRPMARG
jgi:Fe-S oxidoreductase